jgi:hypothetical protein
MTFSIEYLGLCGRWLTYSHGQTQQGAMVGAMNRKKSMNGRPVRVLNNLGHVVACF